MPDFTIKTPRSGPAFLSNVTEAILRIANGVSAVQSEAVIIEALRTFAAVAAPSPMSMTEPTFIGEVHTDDLEGYEPDEEDRPN